MPASSELQMESYKLQQFFVTLWTFQKLIETGSMENLLEYLVEI